MLGMVEFCLTWLSLAELKLVGGGGCYGMQRYYMYTTDMRIVAGMAGTPEEPP